jgi:hypothetical protein
MTSFIFNYNTFYNYYTNRNNLFTDTRVNKPLLNLFLNEPSPNIVQSTSTTTCSDKFITIGVGVGGTGGIGVYIKQRPNRTLLFTIPTKINGVYWDFHYHFGITYFSGNRPIVFFS